MTGRSVVPHYADYKKFIAMFYPEAAPRIAVSRNGAPTKRKAIEAELRSQLPQDVISEISESDFSRHLGGLEHFLNFSKQSGFFAHAMGFYNRKIEIDQPKFYYIILRPECENPVKWLHSYSHKGTPSTRMKFNRAAQNPAALQWFSFSHELCHVLISSKNLLSAPDERMDDITQEYYRARVETICDSYAAVQTLRMMGEAAIPTLRVLADMRLSNFPLTGPEYFTSLAIREVLKRAEKQGIENLRSMDRDELHAYVLQVSADHYFSKADFSVLHPAYKIVADSTKVVSDDYKRVVAVEAIKQILGPKRNAQEGSFDRKLSDECMRAFEILEKDYSYASLFEKVKDKVQQACTPGSQSGTGQGPTPGP